MVYAHAIINRAYQNILDCMELYLLIALGIVSLVVGVLAAVVGSSQIILLPIMTFFGMPIHSAIGTFKIAAVARDLSSTINYRRKKLINIRKTSPFFLSGIVGAILGANIVISLPAKTVESAIGVLMILLAVLIFNDNLQKIVARIPKHHNKFWLVTLGFVVGLYEGFYGAGDTLFMIAIFVSLLKFDFLRSAANARLVNLVQAAFSATVFGIRGLIDFTVALPIIIGLSLGAWYGVEIATKIGKEWIKRIFIVFTILLGLKFILFH